MLNTVPYVKEWITSTDATMGLVQTQTIDEQDAGGARDLSDVAKFWTHTSADALPDRIRRYAMPTLP